MKLGLSTLSFSGGGPAAPSVPYVPPNVSYSGTAPETDSDDATFILRQYDAAGAATDGTGTFSVDRDTVATIEAIGPGGPGGWTGTWNRSGSGGGGAQVVETVRLTAGTPYSLTIGAGGQAVLSGGTDGAVGTSTAGFGLTAPGGGIGGSAVATIKGGAGACCGSGAQTFTSDYNWNAATHGGFGWKSNGGSGGMGSDGAGGTTGAGAGVVSPLFGDTVCAGAAQTDVTGAGADATGHGNGGFGGRGGASGYKGGHGAPGRIGIRIGKTQSEIGFNPDTAQFRARGMSLTGDWWNNATADLQITGELVGGSGEIEFRLLDTDGNQTLAWTSAGTFPEGAINARVAIPRQSAAVTNGRRRIEYRIAGRTGTERRPFAEITTALTALKVGQSNTEQEQAQFDTAVIPLDGHPVACPMVKINAAPASVDTNYLYWSPGVRWAPGTAVSRLALDCVADLDVNHVYVGGSKSAMGAAALAKGGLSGAYEAIINAYTNGWIGRPNVIFSQQGENDWDTTPFATWAGIWEDMHADFAADFGMSAAHLPFLMSPLATANNDPADAGDHRKWFDYKLGQQDIASYISNCVYVGSWGDATLQADLLHATARAFHRRAVREHRRLMAVVGLESDPGYCEMTGGSIVNGTTTDLTISKTTGATGLGIVQMGHGGGTDLTTVGTDTALEVSTDEVTWHAANTTIVDANTIRAVTVADLGAGTRYTRYQYGQWPNATCIRDNSAEAWPLEFWDSTEVA